MQVAFGEECVSRTAVAKWAGMFWEESEATNDLPWVGAPLRNSDCISRLATQRNACLEVYGYLFDATLVLFGFLVYYFVHFCSTN